MSQPVETTEIIEAPTTEVEVTDNKELSPEEMKAELKKVRQEAASRRIALREAEEKAKKWSEYEESQKSELQKMQDKLAENEKLLTAKDQDILRVKVAKKYGVADEDLDLLVGDESNMERLAQRLGSPQDKDVKKPADLLAGNRGKPVGGSSNTFSMEDFIRGSVK